MHSETEFIVLDWKGNLIEALELKVTSVLQVRGLSS
jgi:hypothetical protein